MSEVSPLVPSPASVSVQEAFDRYYAGLVSDLTPLCGSPIAAEAAVDEAFRRAAAQADFAEIGRPREWLLAMARNHVVRKPFRQDDLTDHLTGDLSAQASGGFERPSLAASLERARGAHRGARLRSAGLVAAGVIAALALAVAAPQLNPLTSQGSQPAAAPSPSSTWSPGASSLLPTDHPTSTTPTSEPWPPAPRDIIGQPGSVRAYTVVSTDTPKSTATVWKRCRPQPPADTPPCEYENAASAVEVSDAKGHRATYPIEMDQSVRPGFNGMFVILGGRGEDARLIAPTMTVPKPFTVRSGAKPKPGQVFSDCSTGPCLLDLHGTVTVLDLPANAQWYADTAEGWVGWSGAPMTNGSSSTIFIQQPNGAFASVEVHVLGKSLVDPNELWLQVETRSGGVVLASLMLPSGQSQVAVSTDHGRTWQFRWTSPSGAPVPTNWRALTVAAPAMLAISPLKRVD